MADPVQLAFCFDRKSLTVERLKESLTYDPDTGLFTWNARAKGRNSHVGKVAGARTSESRVIIRLDYQIYYAHRLAWLYMTGHWPAQFVDHIDGDPSNNRWANLREATAAQNAWNSRVGTSNTSGHKGVNWFKQYGMWRALIKREGKDHFLGYFHSKQDAIDAYRKAAEELHGEFARF